MRYTRTPRRATNPTEAFILESWLAAMGSRCAGVRRDSHDARPDDLVVVLAVREGGPTVVCRTCRERDTHGA